MDPRERADAALARARSRGAFVVTPEDAVSPMDASSTQQIPQSVIDAEDPESTAVVPSSVIESAQRTVPKPDTRVGLTPVRRPVPEEEHEVEGLIPTTMQPSARSDLSRRLEGL